MDFVFRFSSYDDAFLETETTQALEQLLEAYSRAALPGVWSITDKLNAYAAKGPGREKRAGRYRLYGVILITLGIFAAVPGLMEPKELWSVLVAGTFALFVGIAHLCAAKKRPPKKPGPTSRKTAAELLERMRGLDFDKTPIEIRFAPEGMTIAEKDKETGKDKTAGLVLYQDMTGIYEEEHIWLAAYGKRQAVLLQKKDLITGTEENFSCFASEKRQLF